ncbi:maleylpyruvate isomerase N-terminal domain-containing protein [Streptomyces winkii]|uniref:maleylpyruvate isomerase N-terminal domain-containing protein n=1 Tax=Streptomyces winkii TaxID=3051178 RepID=UPI0028D75882|nr:maleylpyruvate isomerase N-terminal domain-containing protein [Streptomyces sp. DSM 40971]
MTNALAFDRYCAEIIEQTRLLRDTLKSAGLDSRVPTCPEWTLRDLAVHVGDGHRRAAELVRTRATSSIRADDIPGCGGPADLPEAAVAPGAYVEALSTWLSESAQLVSDELRVAGEESPAWTFAGEHRAAFWARRRTHETLVHRADAALAAGAGFDASPGLTADCMDELLELAAAPEASAKWPALRTLAERAGDTLHLHATDTSRTVAAEWLIRIEEDGFTWTRTHEKATTAVRGPLTDLFLVLFRRLAPAESRSEVLGDAGLLEFWLERVRF